MGKSKKPTLMEVKNVINNMLKFMTDMQIDIRKVDSALSSYIEYKGDKDGWMQSVRDKINKEELNGSSPKEYGKSSGRNNPTPSRKKGTKQDNTSIAR